MSLDMTWKLIGLGATHSGDEVCGDCHRKAWALGDGNADDELAEVCALSCESVRWWNVARGDGQRVVADFVCCTLDNGLVSVCAHAQVVLIRVARRATLQPVPSFSASYTHSRRTINHHHPHYHHRNLVDTVVRCDRSIILSHRQHGD